MAKWRSKHQETKTYDEWKYWAINFYKKLDMKLPVDWWDRTVKVLELNKIEV